MRSKRITGAQLKNHFSYRVWVYALIALVGVFGVDLLYTMTQYRPPAERKVEFQLVQGGAFIDTERLDGVAAAALKAGQAFDGTLEQVAFYNINYSGDGETDVYGAQKYVVMVAAQEGDVWVVPRALFTQLHEQGGLMELSALAQEGLIDTAGLDLAGFMLPAPSSAVDEDGMPLPPDGAAGLYGLPGTYLKGLEDVGLQAQDACIVIMNYSKNPRTAARVLGTVADLVKDGVGEEGQ